MDDDDYGGRPLSNADFRKLLETPRPGATKQEHGEKKKRPKPHKAHRPKPAGKPETAEDEQGYRDRAAERRKGITSDFEAIPEDLANILEGGQAGLNKLSYEESKFLGGDVAHTHLVKGLDFALLQKIRAEQAAKKGQQKEESDEEEEEQAPTAQQRQELKFATPLGRTVYSFFFDPKQRRSRADLAEMFLPRRSAFVFELGDPYAPDVPTLLHRSKEDCPKVQETLLGAVDSSVLERMAKIMSYMSLAGGKKKLKKKDKMQLLQGIALQAGGGKQQAGANGTANGGAAPGPAALAGAGRRESGGGAAAAPPGAGGAASGDDDDDIFADAGTDYVVERKKGASGAGAPAGAGRYFDHGEDMSDLPPLPAEGPAPPPPPPPAGDDMELEELGPVPPPPPPDAEAGPARPPAGYDYSSAYAQADAYGAYPDTDAAYGQAAAAGAGAAQQGGAGGLSQEEKAAGLGSVFKRDDNALRRRAAANDGDDAYAECYPSYYSYAGTVVDSDDEEGGAKGARGQQPQGLSRLDFGSEEEYREYLAANPERAAAAGGGKGDARKGQREARKRDQQQQQKLSSQLGKIQRIMEEKGHDHAGAFKKGGGGSGGGGGEGSEPAMPAKKRRI